MLNGIHKVNLSRKLVTICELKFSLSDCSLCHSGIEDVSNADKLSTSSGTFDSSVCADSYSTINGTQSINLSKNDVSKELIGPNNGSGSIFTSCAVDHKPTLIPVFLRHWGRCSCCIICEFSIEDEVTSVNNSTYHRSQC